MNYSAPVGYKIMFLPCCMTCEFCEEIEGNNGYSKMLCGLFCIDKDISVHEPVSPLGVCPAYRMELKPEEDE